MYNSIIILCLIWHFIGASFRFFMSNVIDIASSLIIMMWIIYHELIQGVPLHFDLPVQPKLQGVVVLFIYYCKYTASKVMNLKFHAIRSIIKMSSLYFLNCSQLLWIGYRNTKRSGYFTIPYPGVNLQGVTVKILYWWTSNLIRVLNLNFHIDISFPSILKLLFVNYSMSKLQDSENY